MREKDTEYLMIREEMLQHIKEYQAVRNMMYIVTATTLGFGLTENVHKFESLFLLPLIVILPSYIVSTRYWMGVIKLATYLMVFHEQEKDCSFCWETCNYMLVKKNKFTDRINYHHVPYVVSGFMCITLYFGNLNWKNNYDILLGISALIICVLIFFMYKDVDREEFLNEWMKIKQNQLIREEDLK